MSVTIRWNGTMLLEQQRRRIQAAVLRAAVLLHTRARVLCSTPARREVRRRTRDTSAGRRGSTYTHYVPSRPGQPPALRTGLGRSAITWSQVDDLTARVGVRDNGVYMAYLETGTRRIARRPWLSRALDDCRDAVTVLLTDAARVTP
jgi:hypothetical protein